MSENLPLLLFAKAPIPGKVKTRLQSHCSAEQAAQIAEVLLEESLIQATTHWPGNVYLSVALDSEHPFLQKMCEKYSVELTMQCVGDLGDKMSGAFDQFGYPAAIMGCDAPHIRADDLIKAHGLLTQGDSVLGPSEDGGYYFIGLASRQPSIFKGISWGNETVMQETQLRAKELNLDFRMLSPLNDIDEWQDLQSVAKKLTSLAKLIN